jgi:hypothetical protein
VAVTKAAGGFSGMLSLSDMQELIRLHNVAIHSSRDARLDGSVLVWAMACLLLRTASVFTRLVAPTSVL